MSFYTRKFMVEYLSYQGETAWRQQGQGVPVTSASGGDMIMDPNTLETYRQRLLVLQQHIVQRIFGMEEAMLAMDADRDIERTDRVQEEAVEVALTALDEQGRREMEAIQAALARIDAGTYGICETCGETISAARLTAMPAACRCVACQERLEHSRTQA
jgi:DnaK suppressor protein